MVNYNWLCELKGLCVNIANKSELLTQIFVHTSLDNQCQFFASLITWYNPLIKISNFIAQPPLTPSTVS